MVKFHLGHEFGYTLATIDAKYIRAGSEQGMVVIELPAGFDAHCRAYHLDETSSADGSIVIDCCTDFLTL